MFDRRSGTMNVGWYCLIFWEHRYNTASRVCTIVRNYWNVDCYVRKEIVDIGNVYSVLRVTIIRYAKKLYYIEYRVHISLERGIVTY